MPSGDNLIFYLQDYPPVANQIYHKRNNARSVLYTGMSSSDETLYVSSAATFPTDGNFIVTIWDASLSLDPIGDPNMEIVEVTAVFGNMFAVLRGREGTNPHAHASGCAVEMLITAGQLVQIETILLNHAHNMAFSPFTAVGMTSTNVYDAIVEAFNHGGVFTESDPNFAAWWATNPLSGYALTSHNHNSAYQPIGSYLTSEADPLFIAWKGNPTLLSNVGIGTADTSTAKLNIVGNTYANGNISIGTSVISAPLTIAAPYTYIGGSGGDTVTEVNILGVWYKIHKFTTTGSSTFTAPSYATNVEVLVVGGGGGGSFNGGAAGIVLSNNSYATASSEVITVVVGAAGGVSASGGSSQFGTMTATGGQAGGSNASYSVGGTNSAPYGRGGGGAGSAGNGAFGYANGGGGGDGGAATASNILGTTTYYGAGGNGGSYGAIGANYTNINGINGLGGSGYNNTPATAGATNTGSGGGGEGGQNGYTPRAGGSGIVIVRYVLSYVAPSTTAVFGGKIIVGVNETDAAANVTIKGATASNATSSLLIRNSAGTSLFRVRDDGKVGINQLTPTEALDVVGNIKVSGTITATSIVGSLAETDPVFNSWLSSPTGLTKSNVGLDNVDNTSDANKPISTATQTALNQKTTAGFAVAMAIGL
jgi:hypothetical protein